MTRTQEVRDLCQEILRLHGNPEVYEQANSLNPDRRCHFLDTFQDFLEDKYRDLLLEATLPGPDKSFCGTSGMADSCNARIRRCRRGSPGHLRFAALRQGLRASRREPDALEACLSHSVGSLAIPKLIKELQVKYISSFGTHSWGSQLFEKQKELAADAWPKSSMGTWPVLTHIYRRRPCGVTESGRAKDLEKLAKIGASEISPFFYPEEAAACSVTLITEPSMSLAGQVMSIARDGEGTLERIFLDDQLPPEASSDVAQARFAKGTKLTIIEPMLVVSRDGLRGMAVQAGEARRLSVGMEPAHARAAGNKAVALQKFAAAAELYCIGLQHPDLDLLVTILSNRCQAAPLYICQKRCKVAQAAVEEAGYSMMTGSKEDTEELNKQYALRLQEFQDARKEMAKIAAKKNAPSEEMMAAVAPYFEAEEEHRGQVSEEEAQEQLLRQVVVQAKARYHGALRSLENLSNQAHLRRSSSGSLDAVSRTGTNETDRGGCSKRSPVQTPERPMAKVLPGKSSATADSRRRWTPGHGHGGHGPSTRLQKDVFGENSEDLAEEIEDEMPAS